MSITALTLFFIGATVLWGGLATTLAIAIRKGNEEKSLEENLTL
ncbi:MAG: MetS family NSS transporter small subunit [Sarcina sp.]